MKMRDVIQASLELWGAVICFFVGITLMANRRKNSYARNKREDAALIGMHAVCMLILIGDALSILLDGSSGVWQTYVIHISTFLMFCGNYIGLLFYTCYILDKIALKERKHWLYILFAICTISLFMIAINSITHWIYYFDEDNRYCRGDFFPVMLAFGMFAVFLDAIVLIRRRRQLKGYMFYSMLSYIALPEIAAVALFFSYGISFINIALAISMLWIFVASIQEYYDYMKKREQEIQQQKMDTLLAQISPHFIYNSLNTIQALCLESPKEAAQTVYEFAGYLRGNLGVLKERTGIPFIDEVEHVKHYVALEKQRYGDRIEIIWNLEPVGFEVPPLSLQTVVENAIRHGVSQKDEGGTVTISTSQDKQYYYIHVVDDGVGFDVEEETEEWEQEEHDHIGIQTLKKRIAFVCNGELIIKSSFGRGTSVEMRIPKEK